MSDAINPLHYKKYPIEAIELIEMIQDPCIANAIKYLWRAGDKGNMEEDLAKAEWYLERYKKNQEKRREQFDNKLALLHGHMSDARLKNIRAVLNIYLNES